MTYKQLKWFILLIPTFTVGIWEYVRHEYLLPYISMDLGNWLTPVIVLFVTFTLLTRFFTKLETMQEQLRVERSKKDVLQERERIVHDLHDGIAQSLFLLSIKVKQLDKLQVAVADEAKLTALNENIAEIHDYVRTGIENLRSPAQENVDFCAQIQLHITRFESETTIIVVKTIEVDEALLSESENSALPAFIGEALTNIRKHAEASKVTLDLQINTKNRHLLIEDNGIGIDINEVLQDNHYGLKMLHERCQRID